MSDDLPGTLLLTATEFKAKCLKILDRLADHSLRRVVVTKRGRAVAILEPPETPQTAVLQPHGFMRGSVIAPEGFDFSAPTLEEPLFADQGELHQ